jgi:glycosyltransferase involved in cell wall biosynthesis
MLSVIVPAYKAVKYIDESVTSLQGAEILVGVDSCQETLDHLKDHPNIRLFYFPTNVGPYVIKNTLIDEASHDSILFFDADDVLYEGSLQKIEEQLQPVHYLKLTYINFYNKIVKQGHKMSDAVIAIKRDVFNQLNGFYPWICGADTELGHRLEHNKLKHNRFDGVAYHRRLHGDNLTMRPSTKHGSEIRNKYMVEIANKQRNKHWPNPDQKQTSAYVTY